MIHDAEVSAQVSFPLVLGLIAFWASAASPLFAQGLPDPDDSGLEHIIVVTLENRDGAEVCDAGPRAWLAQRAWSAEGAHAVTSWRARARSSRDSRT